MSQARIFVKVARIKFQEKQNFKKLQELIVANQRKVQKLHFMIWISKEVVSETPKSFSH